MGRQMSYEAHDLFLCVEWLEFFATILQQGGKGCDRKRGVIVRAW